MGCPCYCHLPGSKVYTVDGGPCCADMSDERVAPNPVTPIIFPGMDAPAVSAVAPKLYEMKPGDEQREEDRP